MHLCFTVQPAVDHVALAVSNTWPCPLNAAPGYMPCRWSCSSQHVIRLGCYHSTHFRQGRWLQASEWMRLARTLDCTAAGKRSPNYVSYSLHASQLEQTPHSINKQQPASPPRAAMTPTANHWAHSLPFFRQPGVHVALQLQPRHTRPILAHFTGRSGAVLTEHLIRRHASSPSLHSALVTWCMRCQVALNSGN